MKPLRCAIYTRKSSEEGLEQDFNSLHAQREACEAFICSQKHEGWKIVPTPYDDGGFSGGNMERPGLRQLLADIKAKAVDIVVVYKIDRLTRSLMDFARMVEVFDAGGVSFVSVTQQFNTTTSMGRLTLNVLLSFAQFEREVTGERIRDKIKASKQKGMWMGGNVPIGYNLNDRKLWINEAEAEQVRWLFTRYAQLGSARATLDAATRKGIMGKLSGKPMHLGALQHLLRNPIYIGRIRHKTESYPGLHKAIVDEGLFQKVQEMLDAHQRRKGTRGKHPSLLVGLVEDGDGGKLTPSHAVKKGKRYCYYVSTKLIKEGGTNGWRIPAHDLESLVQTQLKAFLTDPRQLADAVGAQHLKQAIERGKDLHHRMEDGEKTLILRQLVSKVVVQDVCVEIHLSTEMLRTPRDPDTKTDLHVLTVPTALRRCGMEMRLVLPNSMTTDGAKPDAALLQLLDRGEDWMHRLMKRKASSGKAIAEAENLSLGYICRLLPLAFLSPRIKDAIRQGTQPITLTAQHLQYIKDLPLSWKEQESMLGFPDA